MLPAAFDPIDEHRSAGSDRVRLPNLRSGAAAFKFRVGDGEGFVHVGEYADGRPGEVFLRVAKQGSTLAGLTEALTTEEAR